MPFIELSDKVKNMQIELIENGNYCFDIANELERLSKELHKHAVYVRKCAYQ